MIPLIAALLPTAKAWFLRRGFQIGLAALILLAAVGLWWYVIHLHNTIKEADQLLEKEKKAHQQREELHQAREALLTMTLQGHEAARLADEKNEEIIRAIAEKERIQSETLRNVVARQSRRLDELFNAHQETKSWADTPHPMLVNDCMRTIVAEANRSGDLKGVGTLTAQSGCDLTGDSMDSSPVSSGVRREN